MAKSLLFFSIWIWIFQLCQVANGGMVTDKIYRGMGGHPCTRLANSTHLIGCSSLQGGNAGTLLSILSSSQLDSFLSNPGKEPRIVLLDPSLVTIDTLEKLSSTKMLGGVLVPPGKNPFALPLISYSAEEKHPNKQFGLYPNSNFIWNPQGNAINYHQINIPISYITQKQFDSFQLAALTESNKASTYPQNGGRISSWMHASGPSDTCLRRSQCDPLGGKSVWGAIGGKINPDQKIVMLVAHLDATALFHDKAVGADAAVSGKISLLLAADALAQAQKKFKFEKQVVIALFDGESWGYLGSKRFVRDLLSFKCNSKLGEHTCKSPFAVSTAFQNISFSSIESIVEVGQVGNLPTISSQTKIYMHSDLKNKNDQLKSTFENAATATQMSIEDASKQNGYPGLPPSSLMAFLKEKSDISSIFIAEHESHYTNPFFGSHLDDENNIQVSSLVSTAKLITSAVLKIVGVDNSSPDISTSLAEELVECFTRNFTCELSQKYLPGLGLNSEPTAYVGVWGPSTISVQSKLVHDVLYDLIKVEETSTTCTQTDDCNSVWGDCVRGKCLVGATYYHDALSVGLEFDYDAWNWIKTEKWASESTWTESRWDSTTQELFVVDNPSSEMVTLIFGIIITVLCFLFVYSLKANLFKLFKSV